MRTPITAGLIGLFAALVTGPEASSDEKPQAEALFAGDLKDWSRTGSGKNPWRLSGDRGTLTCPAGVTESYLPERFFGDGELRFSYRFLKTDRKEGYAAGVSVRKSSAEAMGCKVALGDACGTMTATFSGSSDRVKVLEEKPTVQAARPVGDWNDVTIRLAGRSVRVEINGKEVAAFDSSDTEQGLVSLDAEGSEIDFRDVKWQPAK